MLARALLRVSTDRQAEARTIESQRAPVHALAGRLGATEIVEYREDGVSGAAPLDERDVLRRLLAEAQPGDLVVAYDLSRLTRSDDWIERYLVLGHLRRAALRPATVRDGEIDLHSLGGRITAHIQGEIAADERSKILSRTRDGHAQAVEAGRLAHGRAPYGYGHTRKSGWTVDEERAAVVREIFRRVVGGETCREIAADLALRNAPTCAPKKTCPDPRWHTTQVWRIATAAVYRGELAARTRTGLTRTVRVPPLVDAETWHEAQAQLGRAKRRGLRKALHPYLLDGGAGRCKCGGLLGIKWGKPGPRSARRAYYACTLRCGLKWRRVEDADARVWAALRARLEDPAALARALAGEGRESEEAATEARAAEAEAAGVLARLGTVEAAVLARYRAGMVSDEALDAELAAIAAERRAATERRAEAAGRLRAATADRGRLEDAAALLRAAAAEADRATAWDRRKWCRAIGVRATLTDGGIRVTLPVASVSRISRNTEHGSDGEICLEIAA